MGQGLRIWDENGVNLVDTDYRMTQILGSVFTADLLGNDAYKNGNIHVPEFATMAGSPFVLNIPTDVQFAAGNGTRGHARNARVEGNFVKWDYETTTSSGFYTYACWIIWGVY